MLTIPFKNDFYSYIIPSNRDELINHCVNAKKLEGNLSWGDNCLIEKENINQDGFSEILEPIIKQFLLEITNIPFKYHIDELWRNTYRQGYHQEIHHHSPADISFVIFLNDYVENDAKFYFYNERSRVTSTIWKKLCYSNQFYMNEFWNMNPEKGSIILFPSHMLHGVSPHKSVHTRTTVSGNILIDKT